MDFLYVTLSMSRTGSRRARLNHLDFPVSSSILRIIWKAGYKMSTRSPVPVGSLMQQDTAEESAFPSGYDDVVAPRWSHSEKHCQAWQYELLSQGLPGWI